MTMIYWATSQGRIWEALAWWLGFGGPSRGADLEELRFGDIIRDVGEVGPTLGDPQRGSEAKTGKDQGIISEDAALGVILNSVFGFSPGYAAIFQFSMAGGRKPVRLALCCQSKPKRNSLYWLSNLAREQHFF